MLAVPLPTTLTYTVYSRNVHNGFDAENPRPRDLKTAGPRQSLLQNWLVITGEYVAPPSDTRFVSHFLELRKLEKISPAEAEIAESPSPQSIHWAEIVLKSFEQDSLVPTKVVASTEGGVTICFVDGDNYADIECLNSGEILGVTSNRRDRPSVWEIRQDRDSIARASALISQFIGQEASSPHVAVKQAGGSKF